MNREAGAIDVEFVRVHVVARGTGLAPANIVNSMPVLIVDDDEASRELMTKVLRLTGFGTVTAENGADALKYLRTGGDACIILLDLMMPVMDGFEFRREQLSEPRLAAIPVVVLSAIASTRASEFQGCAIFDKPVNVFEVADAVRRLCRRSPGLPDVSLPSSEQRSDSGSTWPDADGVDIVDLTAKLSGW
jgi:CheY-like chemotaxis protein